MIVNMAMPIFAQTSAGASFIPYPVMATVRPLDWISFIASIVKTINAS